MKSKITVAIPALMFLASACSQVNLSTAPSGQGDPFVVAIDSLLVGRCEKISITVKSTQLSAFKGHTTVALTKTGDLQGEVFHANSDCSDAAIEKFDLTTGGASATEIWVYTTQSGTYTAQISAGTAALSGKLSFAVGPGEAHHLVASAGADQIATVGASLAKDFQVLVADRFENPVPDTDVAFAVTAGGGTLAHATVTSGDNGIAGDRLQVGTTAGIDNQIVRASSTGLAGTPTSVLFRASARAGLAHALAFVGSATANTATCGAYKVRIIDSTGNAVAAQEDTDATLSDTGAGGFFSEATCTTPATHAIVVENSSEATVYYKDTTAEALHLNASNADLVAADFSLVVGNLVPLSAALVSDKPLIATDVVTNQTLPLSATAPITTASAAPSPSAVPSLFNASAAPTTGAAAVNIAVTNTVTLSTAVNDVSSAASFNAGSSFTAHVSVDAVFPDGVPNASKNCLLLSPFSATTCLIPSFSLLSTDFSAGTLQARLTSANGGPNDYLLSNALPVRRFRMKQLTDLTSGGDDGFSLQMELNGRLFFTAYDVNYNRTIFSTDLTTEIVQVADGLFYEPYSFIKMNGRIYFTAYDTSWHAKLFSTDGVDIRQHTDLYSGNYDNPSYLTVMNNRLYFVAQNGAATVKLYSTNGTDLRQHTNLFAGSNDSITGLTAAGNRIYFSARTSGSNYMKLYSTDGVDLRQHTDLVSGATDDVTNLKAAGSRLVFVARQNSSGHYKVFSTDGTDLVRVSNLVNGNTDSPAYVTAFNGRVYFRARIDTSNHYKLFSTNGLDLKQVSDIRPGGDDGILNPFVGTNKLYFLAYDTNGLMRQFSTTDGSSISKEIDFGTSGSESTYPIRDDASGNLYFSYNGEVYRKGASGLAKFISGGLETSALLNGKLVYIQSGVEKLSFVDATSGARISDLNKGGFDTDSFNCNCNCGSPFLVPMNSKLYVNLYSSINTCTQKLYEVCEVGDTGCDP